MSIVNRYYAPTPKWARIIGDVALVVGTGITGTGLAEAYPVLSAIGMAMTLISKSANLFVEKNS